LHQWKGNLSMRTSQIRRINCLLIKTKVFGTSIQLKPFRIEWNARQNSYQDLPIRCYCVQCSYVHLSVSKLSINAFIKRNHLLWNLCFQSVCGKNPTLIASPPKRMGCVVWVSSNFKLKFVSKRSKNDSKKNVGEFFWDLKIALCSNRFFFSRNSRSYMYFQLKNPFFLGYEHFLSSRLD